MKLALAETPKTDFLVMRPIYYHVYLLQITMNVKKLDKVAAPRDVETQLVVLIAFVVQGIASMQMDHPVMVSCL